MPDEVWRIRVEAEDNLDQLLARINEAKMNATQLGGQEYGPAQRLSDQAAVSQQRAMVDLARAQEQAAMSSMNQGQKVNYLRGELEQLEPDTLRYYQVQTQLNNEMNRGRDISEVFTRQLTRIGIGLAVWGTLRTVQQYIQETIQAMGEYDAEVTRFAAVTDQSVGEAANQYKLLRDTAAQGGFTPSQAAPGIQQVARYTKNPQEQTELFSAATKLSEALGLKDTTQATEALGSAMLSTGKSAHELANLVATAFKEMGGDPQQLMDGLRNIQALSDETGTDFTKMFSAIARGAEESHRSLDTVSQVVNRFAQNIENLNPSKIAEFASQIQELSGVNVLNPDSTLKSVDQILTEISSKWETFSPEIQSKIVDALGGGKLRGQALAAGTAVMDSWGKGALDTTRDNLNQMTAMIDQSLSGMLARVNARIDEIRANGNPAGLIAQWTKDISVAGGWIFGGQQGATQAARAQDVSTSITAIGEDKTKQNFVQSLSGLSKDDARKAIDEYNAALFEPGATKDISKAIITDAQKQQIIDGMSAAGTAAGNAFDKAIVSAIGNVGSPILSSLSKLIPGISGIFGGAAAAAQQPLVLAKEPAYSGPPVQQNQNPYLTNLNATIAGGGTDQEITKALDVANATDLMKYSVAEINRAKQMSVQLENQYLQQVRASLAAQGEAPGLIDEAVAALQRQNNAQTDVLRTQAGLMRMGSEQARFFQQSLQDQRTFATQQKQAESNFVFQRHKDISPDQFPQLQALTAMYDAMLTKLGSPEKEKNINLLLGDNNTFKTMTARLTALQMAMEDLTKVEKAQLSGTWNLPSGATALVPISSLDLQRWNKGAGGGGGMSPDQLTALLDQMGLAAKQQAADQTGLGGGGYGLVEPINNTTQAVNASGDKIVGALQHMWVQNPWYQQYAARNTSPLAPVEKQPWQQDQQPWYEKYGTGFKLPQNQDGIGFFRDTRSLFQTPLPQQQSLFNQFGASQSPSAAPVPVKPVGESRDMELYRSLLSEMSKHPFDALFPAQSRDYRQQQTLGTNPPVADRRYDSIENTRNQRAADPAFNMITSALDRFSSTMTELSGNNTKQTSALNAQKMTPPPVNVNVSMLPVKATLAANLSVVLDGAVIARALMPLMYDMLTRQARASSVQQRGILR